MTNHVAINAILAIGMLLVILNGGIDLSVGSTVGLAGVVAGYLMQGSTLPLTRRRSSIPPVWVVIVISLAASACWSGCQRRADRPAQRRAVHRHARHALRRPRPRAADHQRPDLHQPAAASRSSATPASSPSSPARPLGMPMPVWVMIVFAVVVSIVLNRTPSAAGSTPPAATSGRPSCPACRSRGCRSASTCSPASAPPSPGFLSSQLTRLRPPTAGTFYELNAIAAVVIGGAALSGGRGTIRGTILGAFVIGFLSDGLVIVGVSAFWQKVITAPSSSSPSRSTRCSRSPQKRRSVEARCRCSRASRQATPGRPDRHRPAPATRRGGPTAYAISTAPIHDEKGTPCSADSPPPRGSAR